MNDEMSHLGYLRKADGEARAWDLLTVGGTLTSPCRNFLQHIRAKPELMTGARPQACDQILEWLPVFATVLRDRHDRATRTKHR